MMLFMISLSLNKVTAQIIYTDIIPDSTVSASESEQIKSYFIDLDNNGVYEYELRHFNPDPQNMDVELQRNYNNIQEVIIWSSGHAKVLNKDDSISQNSAQWGNDGFGILNAPWYGGSDKYFGFRFKLAEKWHYGWARVQLKADHSDFTIKDYAFNSIANAPLLAGQISSGNIVYHKTAFSDFVSFFPNPVVNKATVQINYPPGSCDMIVYNLLGEKVRVLKQLNTGKLTFYRENLKSGVYFYEILYKNEILFAGKFLIRDN